MNQEKFCYFLSPMCAENLRNSQAKLLVRAQSTSYSTVAGQATTRHFSQIKSRRIYTSPLPLKSCLLRPRQALGFEFTKLIFLSLR